MRQVGNASRSHYARLCRTHAGDVTVPRISLCFSAQALVLVDVEVERKSERLSKGDTMAYVSLKQAIKACDYKALRAGESRYVVLEAGDYYVASDEDLDTFFAGLSDNSILYASGDSEQ
jgi:hypothetical protein